MTEIVGIKGLAKETSGHLPEIAGRGLEALLAASPCVGWLLIWQAVLGRPKGKLTLSDIVFVNHL